MTQRTTWANWQFGLLKLATFSLGILAGVYFHDFWKSILPLVWGIAAVTTVWVTALGVRSLSQTAESAPH